MLIKTNYGNLDKREINMVEKGYGKVVIHSIAFDRSFSDNQKRTNLIKAKSMTKEEWSEYCLQFSKSLDVGNKKSVCF